MNFNPQEEDSIMVGCSRVALSLRMMKTFEADTAMVQVAVSSPTVPNRVTQVVPLAELCSLILATWVRSQEVKKAPIVLQSLSPPPKLSLYFACAWNGEKSLY